MIRAIGLISYEARATILSVTAFLSLICPSVLLADSFVLAPVDSFEVDGVENFVRLEFTNGDSRQGLQIALAYDPEVLSLASVVPVGRILDVVDLSVSDDENGTLRVLAYDRTEQSSGIPAGEGEIVRIGFVVNPDANDIGVTSISVLGALVADSSYEVVSPVSWTDAVIVPTLLQSLDVQLETGQVIVTWSLSVEEVLCALYRSDVTVGQSELLYSDDSPDIDVNEFRHNVSELNLAHDYVYELYLVSDNGDFLLGAKALEADFIPRVFSLEENYPNPFNPATNIRFAVPRKSEVEIRIYDLTGRLVQTLASDVFDAGHHVVTWYGKDRSGHPVSSGVYFCQMHADRFVATQRMLLLK